MKINDSKVKIRTINKSNQQIILSKDFLNTQILDNNFKRKLSFKNEFQKNLRARSKSRTFSPSKLQQSFKLKSGPDIYKKLNSKDNTPQKEPKQNWIYKRRISSQQKGSNKSLSDFLQQKDAQSTQKIKFAKKIIQDLKKQSFKNKNSYSIRYERSKNLSKSMQLQSKLIINNRQNQIKHSLQKLKPSLTTNQMQFHKKSSSSKLNLKKSLLSPAQKQSPMTPTLSSLIPLLNKNLHDYITYIHGQSNGQYFIDLKFLIRYNKLNRNEMVAQIQIATLKLMQSIYLCIKDILTNAHIKQVNLQIVREYALVYFQSYEKITIQYILFQLYKTIKKKLIIYFIMQRLLFFYLIQFTFNKNNNLQNKHDFKIIIQLLKSGENILILIINTILQEKNIKTQEDKSFSDVFKTLRISRQIDKNLPYIRQVFEKDQLFKNQSQKSQILQQIKRSYFILLNQIQKCQNYDSLLPFKLQLYYNWSHLSLPPISFLPPNPHKPFTLILDLDMTLIYYNQQTRILKYRPYMDKFLNTLQQHFQLVVFSSSSKERTDIIVKEIQRDQIIFSYRLYKSHMTFFQGQLRKNIKNIGRNMQRTILIDDQEKHTSYQPLNSYQIKAFTGDKQDKQLLYVLDWLKMLIQESPVDIRGKLKKAQSYLTQIVQIEQVQSTIQQTIQ